MCVGTRESEREREKERERERGRERVRACVYRMRERNKVNVKRERVIFAYVCVEERVVIYREWDMCK